MSSNRESGRFAVAPLNALKRAALLFDSVFVPDLRIPADFPRELLWQQPTCSVAERRAAMRCAVETIPDTFSRIDIDGNPALAAEVAVRLFATSLQLQGFAAIPIYDSERRFLSEYPLGKSIAYQAALENIPEIVEDKASWDEILEFRGDRDALRKYRDLRLWLEHSLTADSVAHASDIIAKRVSDYEWALKKHGLTTTTGAISTILSKESLLTVAGGAGIGAWLGGPVGGAISSGLVVVAKTAVWLAARKIEREDIKRGPGSEIAIIYDAQREFGGATADSS